MSSYRFNHALDYACIGMNKMQAILTTSAVAALVNKPRETIWRWATTLPEWSACISHRSGRRIYLSAARLRAAGLIGAQP